MVTVDEDYFSSTNSDTDSEEIDFLTSNTLIMLKTFITVKHFYFLLKFFWANLNIL